ncbi:heme o synthase [Pseudoduganella albidiflava]|uniref:Protoheme IX farnesyltransferase n=1 Tax=Pseudoduganella albidiflava TaxID=321983 RepID=A0A411X3G2_9BURK|nr:heme o synthase [Pseudoduganella albidiflava]QBI03541.1 protoheme IX farnesyltransferase [Pseudoduganella albidiflava]GGY50877.1 protoheme IX farnesyltransferase [Pseudoduganella albidiflava]
MTAQAAAHRQTSRIAQYWALTKPRVTQLAVFCAVIGMFLATDGLPDWRVVVAGTIGIWLLAGAAFAVNCLAEREIDARMARTARRPMARGEITPTQTMVFSSIIGGAGMWILYALVNPLTMWLTFVTFVGYAVIYTMILKPATPQNIVIGGLSGAMPPALGWAAIANEVPMQAWLLVLIIFLWTPPHFWALALYRRDDYAKSGLPMLPVTHGMAFAQFHVFLYSIALAATTLLPFAVGMSGLIYLASAIVLDAVFLWYGWRIWRNYSDLLARKAFAFSILYLALLFGALLLDHYIRIT